MNQETGTQAVPAMESVSGKCLGHEVVGTCAIHHVKSQLSSQARYYLFKADALDVNADSDRAKTKTDRSPDLEVDGTGILPYTAVKNAAKQEPKDMLIRYTTMTKE
ncbi:hypothetical protein E4U31_000411 [Claviceps sp. LM219 group G6]|nr:hypothetical protein E4U31_000411 [Claviceps sp. LM219 group G6]